MPSAGTRTGGCPRHLEVEDGVGGVQAGFTGLDVVEDVIALAALELVGTCAAFDQVVCVAAGDGVVAGAAPEVAASGPYFAAAGAAGGDLVVAGEQGLHDGAVGVVAVQGAVAGRAGGGFVGFVGCRVSPSWCSCPCRCKRGCRCGRRTGIHPGCRE